ncbi:sodium:solute symporter family protein [Bacilliculturomica massiliensis]|uniref:sodium:solute symporter family protein n=1 Tax=Bacilliculturomica massiliensis TaxID=1917867 RepID=UPI00102F8BC2|nr:sodium:solute symporter family protein [Bacilliculturomica massiliensis]
MNMLVLSVIGFVVLMLVVGIIVSKKVNDAEDFFVGGRQVPAFLIIATLLASEVGGGVMLGSVGLAYSHGWGAVWYVAPVSAGLILFGIFMSRRLKRDADEKGYQSMFDWLAGRFENYKPLRAVGGTVMLIGFIGALASQFVAMGTALTSVTNLSMSAAIFIGGAVIVLYSTMGGLLSVMWTDLLQACVFLFGMIVLMPMLLSRPEVGGFSGLAASVPDSFFDVWNVNTGQWRLTTLVTMSIAPFVRQYYYQRMFAARTPAVAQGSIFAQAVLVLVITAWTCVVGMCTYLINPNLENPESAMPWVLSTVLPPVVAAILLGAITACVMSTADTFVNSASLTFVRDVYGAIAGELDGKKALKLARVSSLAIGALALVIALFSSSVISAIMNAWAILGGGLFVPMIVSYFWKKARKEGVIASMAGGLLMTLALTLLKTRVPAIIGGVLVSFLLLVTVSIWVDKTRSVSQKKVG